MLGPTSISRSPPLIYPPPPIRRSTLRPLPLYSLNHLRILSLRPKIQSEIPKKFTRFPVLFAENNNGLLNKDPKESEEEQEQGIGSGGGDNSGKDRRPKFDIRWNDLLNPDPDNLLALALTGLLAWASVQVLWQLFFISLAILLAALKYSFIAALLLFILITLL